MSGNPPPKYHTFHVIADVDISQLVSCVRLYPNGPIIYLSLNRQCQNGIPKGDKTLLKVLFSKLIMFEQHSK